MKIKKTIAAIAAAAMVFTALPMAAFADEPVSDGTVTITGGSGTVTKGSVVDGKQEYTVEITGDGDAEMGNAEARKNYHVAIPVEGLTTDWTFDATSQYQFDYDDPTDEQKAFNISNGELKLWLPAGASNWCTVVLSGPNGATKKILIETVKGDTHATKPAATHTLSGWKSDGASHWKECTDEGCTSGSILNAGLHTFVNGACSTCGRAAPVVSSGSSSSAAASTGAPVDTPAASAADMKTASKADVKVDASATKVTPAMVTAFVKNAKTETLTLEYGSTVKVAVAKEDLKDAAKANLDFSVSGKKILSDAAVKSNKTLANAAAIAQMNFVQEGKFNGIDKVTVKNRVGAKFVGQKATVYEYVDGKLVKVAETKVGGSGLVSFKIDHFGQYVIVVEKSAKGAVKKAATADAK